MSNIVQNFDLAFQDKTTQNALLKDDFASLMQEAAPHVQRIQDQYKSGSLPLLGYPEKKDDLAPLEATVKAFTQGATDILILGTGGSSLGGQALCQFMGYIANSIANVSTQKPKLHFLDNIDNSTYIPTLQMLNLASTRFVAVSKSGGTTETLAQTILALNAYKQANLSNLIPQCFLGISETTKAGAKNALRDLLEPLDVQFLIHDDGVGGRYTALTNVGLFPAIARGLDAKALRAGAFAAIEPLIAGKALNEIPFVQGAVFSVLAMRQKKSIQVFLPYSDRLERFSKWWVQLWAESLGKNGNGSTPIAAVGPVDQHSQLQLWLDGPTDKVVTVFTLQDANASNAPTISAEDAKIIGQTMLSNKSINDIVACQAKATAETLARNGLPVRQIHLNGITEATLGEILMHFMLETILSGYMLGIDPFNQPAVEEGKIKTREYLQAL